MALSLCSKPPEIRQTCILLLSCCPKAAIYGSAPQPYVQTQCIGWRVKAVGKSDKSTAFYFKDQLPNLHSQATNCQSWWMQLKHLDIKDTLYLLNIKTIKNIPISHVTNGNSLFNGSICSYFDCSWFLLPKLIWTQYMSKNFKVSLK